MTSGWAVSVAGVSHISYEFSLGHVFSGNRDVFAKMAVKSFGIIGMFYDNILTISVVPPFGDTFAYEPAAAA